jgi:hypothetical protein
MSNRNKWAHWNRPEPKANPTAKWAVGITGIVLGGLLIWSGIQGIRDHVMWYWHFSERWGSFGVSPTYDLFLLGGILLVAGAIALVGRAWPQHENYTTALLGKRFCSTSSPPIS